MNQIRSVSAIIFVGRCAKEYVDKILIFFNHKIKKRFNYEPLYIMAPISRYYAEYQRQPEFNMHYVYKTMLCQRNCHLIDEAGCLTYADFIKLNYSDKKDKIINKPKRKCCQKGYSAEAEALNLKTEMDEKGLTRAEYARTKGWSRANVTKRLNRLKKLDTEEYGE